MVDPTIYDVLDSLSSGDRVRLYPSPNSATVPGPQPAGPFEATVGPIRKKRNAQDSYVDDGEERRVATGSTTKNIWFEADQDGETVEYKIGLTKYRDDHRECDILMWRGQTIQRDQPAVSIGDIEVVDTGEPN